MEWIVQPEGYVPFEHVHVHQDEIFHVKQGEIRVVINHREQIGRSGQTVAVPRGVRHIAYNNSPEVLVCIVEYKPGLDIFKYFQCFGGLTHDRDIDRKYG
ncbi:MAG TPA: cupin domain-containing protein, partial [Anaerolineales bacterium]|nr:cupin domain-containing protein [Anaerolineales bacterium]